MIQLISLLFILFPLIVTLSPCPSGYYLDATSPITRNQSSSFVVYPYYTLLIQLYNSSSVIISSPNNTHSILYWYPLYLSFTHPNLVINFSDPLTMSCDHYLPCTFYPNGFNGSLPSCSFVGITFQGTNDFFITLQDGSNLVNQMAYRQIKWSAYAVLYGSPVILPLSINYATDCKPCPSTCLLCYGSDPYHNCLAPCNESLSSPINNLSSTPLITNSSSNSTNNSSLCLTASVALLTMVTPSLTIVTSSFLQLNNFQSLLIMISLSQTIYNLQFLNSDLALYLTTILNPPLFLQYSSPNYWISISLSPQYSTLGNFSNTSSNFLTNFAVPFILSLLILIASHLSHSLYLNLRPRNALIRNTQSSPNFSFLRSLIYNLILSNSQNLVLYSLLNLVHLIMPPSHQPMNTLDHLNLFLITLFFVSLIASYQSLFRNLHSPESFNTLISQLFQIIYILFVFFSQYLTAATQSIFIFTLFSLWTAFYLLFIECLSSSLIIRPHLTLDLNFRNLQLLSLSHLMILSVIQLLNLNNVLMINLVLFSSQMGSFVLSSLLPLIKTMALKCRKH